MSCAVPPPGDLSPSRAAADRVGLDVERSYLDRTSPMGDLAERYMAALLRRDRNEASRLVLEAETALAVLYTQVFRPVQRELGRLWQLNRVTVAEEHYCTAATQMIISRLYLEAFAAPRRGTGIVVATVPGNMHELGSRMVADLFELAGWDTVYLGPQTPEAVREAVASRGPALVALSASMPHHLPALRATIAALRHEPASAGVPVLVGGLAFSASAELWRAMGADGFAAEAEDAIAWANERVMARPGLGGWHGR
ncbi:MAG: B12-binding domain-containing protein [Candidatus Sericytochromatia bacterium]